MVYRSTVVEVSELVAEENPQYATWQVLNTAIEFTDVDYILFMDVESYNGSVDCARLIVTRDTTYSGIRKSQDTVEDILYLLRVKNEKVGK